MGGWTATRGLLMEPEPPASLQRRLECSATSRRFLLCDVVDALGQAEVLQNLKQKNRKGQ